MSEPTMGFPIGSTPWIRALNTESLPISAPLNVTVPNAGVVLVLTGIDVVFVVPSATQLSWEADLVGDGLSVQLAAGDTESPPLLFWDQQWRGAVPIQEGVHLEVSGTGEWSGSTPQMSVVAWGYMVPFQISTLG